MNANRLTTPKENVQQLQEKLGHAAKENKKRRFHALYDKVYRMDILWEAWRRVRANKGSAGVDGETLADIEKQGEYLFLLDASGSSKRDTTTHNPFGDTTSLRKTGSRDRLASRPFEIVSYRWQQN